MKTYVVISDTQIPYDDRKAMKAVLNFIGDFAPDEVVHIGDLMDFPAPSRWSKGAAEEFEKHQLPGDIADARKRFQEPLRSVYDGPVGVIEGNHDERPRVYLNKYAPAISAYNFYDLPELLDFDSFGMKQLPHFYDFAPDWTMTHGHRGGIRLTQEGGKTARMAAVRMGKSVIMGHTHRLGISTYTNGYDGRILSQLTGVEVGNLMDMRMADYLKGATANWQQGFGLVRVERGHVRVETIPIWDNRFIVDGNVYAL